MAQTGFTPISNYYSATATNVPTAGNLVAGELAINTADGKLFYKDSSGVVQVIGTKGGVGSSSNTQVLYNSSGSVAGSANLTFSGTALTVSDGTRAAIISGRSSVAGTGLAIGTDVASTTFSLNLAGAINTGAATEGVNIAYYSSTSSGWNSAVSVKNTTGTYSNLLLMQDGGNVFIGSTSFPVVGIEKFGVSGGTTIAAAFTSTGTTNPSMFVNNSSNGTVILIRFASGSGGSTVGNITANGTNTTYGTSSDYRLKEDIAPMQNALNVVQQLKPVTYKWKTNGSDGQGFIAHELQAVVPDCVVGEKDAVDKEGKPVYQGIDTSYLVATLTAAIQELNAKVDAQATTIAALQAKVG